MQYVVLIFLILFGCGPSSPKGFQAEGEAKCRELVFLLERVETRDDLLSIEPTLKKKFNEMANLLLAAEKYLQKHPNAKGLGANTYNDDLLYELKRIYEISEGREIIERAQKKPLIFLDRSGNRNVVSDL